MSVKINDQIFEYTEGETIFTFLEMNQIKIPSFSYVEVLTKEDLVDAKNTYLEDEMVIYTNSMKIKNYIKENFDNLFSNILELNPNHYNVLLCDNLCYDECLTKYKEKGFNDIVNMKIGNMIYDIEIANEIMKYITKKYEKEEVSSLLISPIYEVINQKQSLNFKTPAEIISQMIINYYKTTLKINQDIDIIYMINNLDDFIDYYLNQNGENNIKQIVFSKQSLEINNNDNYDGKISHAIYLKEEKNQPMAFYDLLPILEKMGFKIKITNTKTVDNGFNILLDVNNIPLNILFTTTLKTSYTDYDICFITNYVDEFEKYQPNKIITNYNLNNIYKKILIRPGYELLMRRR